MYAILSKKHDIEPPSLVGPNMPICHAVKNETGTSTTEAEESCLDVKVRTGKKRKVTDNTTPEDVLSLLKESQQKQMETEEK